MGIVNRGDVVDGDAVQHVRAPLVDHLHKCTAAIVSLRVNVIQSYVMNTVASASECHATGIRKGGSIYYPRARVTDCAIPDGHIGDLANWAEVGGAPGLVLGRQDNRVTCLRKTAPGVLQDITFEQHALRILQFKIVLYNEGSAICATHEVRCSSHPLQGFEEMVATDLDVGRGSCGRASSKHDVLPGPFQEVVHDLVWTTWIASAAALHCLRISTGARNRYAVEVVEVGVHDGDVGRIVQTYTSPRFVMRCAV